MSYQRNGRSLGATPGITPAFIAGPDSYKPSSVPIAKLPNPALATPAGSGSALGMGLVVAGLGVGAFLLYRHFKKKQAGSTPTIT
jgi:hypothetical protein